MDTQKIASIKILRVGAWWHTVTIWY